MEYSKKMKSWYKSKTIWIAVIQGILGVIVAVGQTFPEAGYFLIVKTFLDIVLRTVTSEAVGK